MPGRSIRIVALPGYFMPQGVSADLIATKYGFCRTDVDAYAVESQKRAGACLGRGLFREVGRAGPRRQRHDHPRPRRAHAAEHQHAERSPRSTPSFTLFGEMGGFDAVGIQAHPEVEAIEHVHHAGNSSGIVDGAAAVLVGSKKAGKQGRAEAAREDPRLRQYRLGAGDHADRPGRRDARSSSSGPACRFADIDLIEINEAFAAVVLRYIQAFDLDPAKVNVNGGAIAMGHPLGATGAMILGTVLDELERRDLSTALVTLCIGAGMGTATIIERV